VGGTPRVRARPGGRSGHGRLTPPRPAALSPQESRRAWAGLVPAILVARGEPTGAQAGTKSILPWSITTSPRWVSVRYSAWSPSTHMCTVSRSPG
jgi:hypothetical protein